MYSRSLCFTPTEGLRTVGNLLYLRNPDPYAILIQFTIAIQDSGHVQSSTAAMQGSLFSDGGQHDSHEFLRYVMNVLHEAYDRVKEKPPYEEFVELEDEEPADKADRLWQVQQAREASPLSDTFQGQLESCVVCTKCQSTFYTYEPFMDLSLSLNKEGVSLEAVF